METDSPAPLVREVTATSPIARETSLNALTREVIDEFISHCLSQTPSPRCSQFLQHTNQLGDGRLLSSPTGQDHQTIGVDWVLHASNPQTTVHASHEEIDIPNLNITRQEIVKLTSVLGRLQPAFILGEDTDPNQLLSVTVTDVVVHNKPVAPPTSSQEEAMIESSSETAQPPSQMGNALAGEKRRRRKYSLKGSMVRKHPVLKFSVTGPRDRELSPHNWWCRVCKTELSLMSQGTPELLWHYRSDSHLIKGHRIRMKSTGMALYDREEKQIHGIALQEAKKWLRKPVLMLRNFTIVDH